MADETTIPGPKDFVTIENPEIAARHDGDATKARARVTFAAFRHTFKAKGWKLVTVDADGVSTEIPDPLGDEVPPEIAAREAEAAARRGEVPTQASPETTDTGADAQSDVSGETSSDVSLDAEAAPGEGRRGRRGS